jgi:hypothetical protein
MFAASIFLDIDFSTRTHFCEKQSRKNFSAGWQSWAKERLRLPKNNSNNKYVHGGDGASIVIQSI